MTNAIAGQFSSWLGFNIMYRKYCFCLFMLYHIPSESMLCAFLYRTRKIRKTSRLIIVADCCNNALSGLEYISLLLMAENSDGVSSYTW